MWDSFVQDSFLEVALLSGTWPVVASPVFHKQWRTLLRRATNHHLKTLVCITWRMCLSDCCMRSEQILFWIAQHELLSQNRHSQADNKSTTGMLILRAEAPFISAERGLSWGIFSQTSLKHCIHFNSLANTAHNCCGLFVSLWSVGHYHVLVMMPFLETRFNALPFLEFTSPFCCFCLKQFLSINGVNAGKLLWEWQNNGHGQSSWCGAVWWPHWWAMCPKMWCQKSTMWSRMCCSFSGANLQMSNVNTTTNVIKYELRINQVHNSFFQHTIHGHGPLSSPLCSSSTYASISNS